MAAGGTPATIPTADAASTSASRCLPGRRTAARGMTGVVTPRRRSHDVIAGDRDAVLERGVEREVETACAGAARQRERGGIVGVHDGPIRRGLVPEDSRLGGGVFLFGRVPIQVVRREVQQHGNPRMERVGGLELKAADFNDVDRVGV